MAAGSYPSPMGEWHGLELAFPNVLGEARKRAIRDRRCAGKTKDVVVGGLGHHEACMVRGHVFSWSGLKAMHYVADCNSSRIVVHRRSEAGGR